MNCTLGQLKFWFWVIALLAVANVAIALLGWDLDGTYLCRTIGFAVFISQGCTLLFTPREKWAGAFTLPPELDRGIIRFTAWFLAAMMVGSILVSIYSLVAAWGPAVHTRFEIQVER